MMERSIANLLTLEVGDFMDGWFVMDFRKAFRRYVLAVIGENIVMVVYVPMSKKLRFL